MTAARRTIRLASAIALAAALLLAVAATLVAITQPELLP